MLKDLPELLYIMANVVDTKLYDILGVSPTATENELKKVDILEIRLYSILKLNYVH